MKESHNFEQACLKEKMKNKEEQHFGRLANFWFSTFMMLFHTTRCVAGHEALENE